MLFGLGLTMARFRWLVIAFWISVFAVAAIVGPGVLGELKGGFGEADTESRRALKLLEEKLGASEASVTVVFSHDTLTVAAVEYRATVEQTLAGLSDLEDVRQVITLYSSGNPDLASDDGHTTYALVLLDMSIDEAMSAFPDLRNRLRAPEGFRLWTTGGIAIFSDLNEASEADLRRAEAVSLPLVLLALAVVFGALVAMTLPVAMAALTVVTTMALVFLLSQVMDVSIFVVNIASFLGIGAAVDYSLLIVSRFREEMGQGSREEAIGLTLSTAGRAILFSGLTTAVGLSGMFFIPFMFFRSLAIGGVTVIILSVVVTLTLLPAILAVLGPGIDRIRVLPSFMGRRLMWRRIALAVMRHPVLVAVPVMAFLLLLGAPFLGVKVGIPWASVLPEDAEARQGWELVEAEMGLGALSPVTVVAQVPGSILQPEVVGLLYDYAHGMLADPRVNRVSSIVTLDPSITRDDYQQMYALPLEALAPVVQAALANMGGDDVTQLSIFTRLATTSDEAHAFLDEVRAQGIGPGVTTLVTGATADLRDSIDLMYGYFPWAILYVVVVSYGVLLLLFRSVVLPLKAVVMNMMSIFASYGALVYIFQHGYFESLLGFSSSGSVEPTIPIIMFCIVFGLSMDYEVFLLSRVKEMYDDTRDNTGSVALGLERTGRVITSAALILVLVAAAFATSDIVVVKAFGVGTAIAILVDATLVRALLVPALMRIMGDWNWWAPRFLRRLLPESRAGG